MYNKLKSSQNPLQKTLLQWFKKIEHISFDMKRIHLNDWIAGVIVTDMYYAIVIPRWLQIILLVCKKSIEFSYPNCSLVISHLNAWREKNYSTIYSNALLYLTTQSDSILKDISMTMIHQIALLEDKEKFTKVYTTYLSYPEIWIEYHL